MTENNDDRPTIPIATLDYDYVRAEFTDVDGNLCILKEDGYTEKGCIHIGRADRTMQINSDTMKLLLPLLQHFAETGELPRRRKK